MTPKIPKTAGACADRLYELKASISELNKQRDALDEERKAIEAWLIDNLPKSDAKGISGKRANVTIVTKEVPTVKDWDVLYKAILRSKDFSLLQRRVSDAAVREHWEAGEVVPGVEAFTAVSVSIKKL